MSSLNQVQLRFIPVEDRLLLQIRTAEAEYRLWMTRRYVRLLWPVLLDLLASNAQVQSQADPHNRSQVLSFQHEQALRQADFTTRYRENEASMPLGAAPVLLSRIQVRRRDGESRVLSLRPAEGPGVELNINDAFLHSFCKLLADTAANAGWDLELGLGLAAPVQGADAPPERVN